MVIEVSDPVDETETLDAEVSTRSPFYTKETCLSALSLKAMIFNTKCRFSITLHMVSVQGWFLQHHITRVFRGLTVHGRSTGLPGIFPKISLCGSNVLCG